MDLNYKRAFWIAAGIAAAAEGVVVYKQWPAPPLKICASVELGELLAAAARVDAELRRARVELQKSPDGSAVKEVMRLESEAGTAANAVAIYKQKALERQKAGGKSGSEACA